MDNTPTKRVLQDIKTLLLLLIFFLICVGVVLLFGVIFGNASRLFDNPYDLHGFEFHDHRLP